MTSFLKHKLCFNHKKKNAGKMLLKIHEKHTIFLKKLVDVLKIIDIIKRI